jgi:hypothetical protein
MLRISDNPAIAVEAIREICDECMATSDERGMIYQKAAQYYFTGSQDARAAIHNKVKPFVDRMAGYLYQPSGVRFNLVFDSSMPRDVLERGETVGHMLTAEYRARDADIRFSDAVLWALITGAFIIKHRGDGNGFKVEPVHPVNFGVLSEAIVSLDEQEAICHVSYPTVTRLRSILHEYGHPEADKIYNRILEAKSSERDQQEPSYFHQMVVGGMRPLGDVGETPQAAGIVQVFPVPTPWRPQRRTSQTVKLCEIWVKDEKRGGDYTTFQLVYPDILIAGEESFDRKNLSGVPGHHPFVKVAADETPGYFWGRSIVADVQMLQDLVNKRLRDLKIMWDRNAAAPKAFSGFTSITEEQYYKIISEGGFINDPNPQAKSQDLSQAPPQGYLEELEFIWKMYDEAGGFTPVLSGQGEPGVRAGVHAQTLVRTSSPGLIDPATRIERQLADSGYICTRMMQDRDPSIYNTDSGIQFTLDQLPDDFQVEVDSHSASPAFAEDSRQVAIALARAQAIDAADLIELIHPPNSELLLARLKQRQAAQAKQAQEQQQEMIAHGINPAQQGGSHGGRHR